uniref:Ig-like domain-containing protein n=1 Tax=Trichobilharzia regenti TaxID=157069 RepID=A0AA85JQJ2_TRIRE|nr:unnamed protein product [Trichobilharzia regenti]
MKSSLKCDLYICIGLLSCIYFVDSGASSSYMQIHDLPKFIMEPTNMIYYSPTQLSASQLIPKFKLYAMVSPRNATIQLGAVHKDRPNVIIYLPTIQEYSTETYSLAFAQTHAKITSLLISEHLTNLNNIFPYISQSNSNIFKENKNLWSISVHNFSPDMKLLILASTKLGTISSQMIDIKPFHLPEFPPQSDKYLSLLIGNTGRVICHLPQSQPSLPTAHFYHNDMRLDLTHNKYHLIYVGGDDSGLPWEVRSQKPHFTNQDTDNNKRPGAVILLIHSLQISDTGLYYCSTSLFDKTVISSQRSHLVVTKPNEKIRTHLRFSTDDADLSHLYTEERTSSLPVNNKNEKSLHTVKEIKIQEYSNLTLFCIFESAPVVSTRWYFNGFMDNIEINQKFGTLNIHYAKPENEGIYTCSVDNSHSKVIGKSFRIVVIRSLYNTPSDPEVIVTETGKNTTLNCNSYLPKGNITSDPEKSLLKSSSEWNKPNFNRAMISSQYDIETRQKNYGFKTTVHTYHWLHNGQFITVNGKNSKYQIQDGVLRILNTTKLDTGIYQYTVSNYRTSRSLNISSAEYRNEENPISCKYFIQLDTEKNIHIEGDDQLKTVFEHTSEGLTGHLNCNLSSLLKTSDYQISKGFNQYQWSILWYRSALSKEPLNIESINKASGGVKYIISNVNEFTQILSVVNPKRVTDDGQYICRVYNTTTGKLLGEKRFQLVIQTNSDEEANNKISNQGEGISNKIFPVPSKSENKYESLVNRLGSEPPSRQEIRKEIPKIKVSKPIVKRLANFTMALYIKWIVFNSPISGLHYQIGLKYFGKKNRKIRSAVSYPYEDKVQENKSNEDDFIILPNIYENTSIILDSSELLHPQNSYALRVLVMEYQLWSPWSEPVHFDNILDTTVQIISLRSNNASCIYVEWIYIQPRNNSISFEIINPVDLNFIIIYRNLSGNQGDRKSLLELWTESVFNDENQFPIDLFNSRRKFSDIHIRKITGDITTKGYLISELLPNTTYAVSVYIEETRSNQRQSERYFTRLSNEAVQKTLPSPLTLTSSQINLNTENSTKERQDVEDTVSQVTSNLKSKMTRQISKKSDVINKLPKIYQHESYVLIVILGSLAGVLLIIFIALITFCIWYRIRLKSQYPRGYFGALSDSEITGTPKQRTITEWENFQSQPVPTTESNQTFPRTTTGNIHLQSLSDQQLPIANFNNFATIQHPTHWIQQPQLPCEGQYRKSMILDNAMKSYWTTMNSDAAKVAPMTAKSKENLNNNVILPLVYNDCSVPHSNAVNRNNECTVIDQIGSLEGIFQAASGMDTINSTTKISNKEIQPINDQSSSIYSHIDSDSTVNELSQFHLDRFNPVLSPATQCEHSGTRRNDISLQNNIDNKNNMNGREVLHDFSQSSNLSFATNSLYPFITKTNDLVSLTSPNPHELLWHQTQPGLIINDNNSFYTTVPPFRHLQYPFNPSDQTTPVHLNMPIYEPSGVNHFQQVPFLQNMYPMNGQQLLCESNPLTSFPTPYASYADSLTAALTLQQWVEHMSKPAKIKNMDTKQCEEVHKRSETQPKLKKNDLHPTKNEQQHLCSENNRHHKSPRENLSSSFADSGVDLPNTSNLETDMPEHYSCKNDSPKETNRRTSNTTRLMEKATS